MIFDFCILRNGLPVFTANFDKTRGISSNQEEITLVSGFFSAINNFVDAFSQFQDIDEIQMKGGVFLSFRRVSIMEGQLLFVVITDQDTPKLYRDSIIQDTSISFIDQFRNSLSMSWNGNCAIYDCFKAPLMEILKNYNCLDNRKTSFIALSREKFDKNIPKNIDTFKGSNVSHFNSPPATMNAGYSQASEATEYSPQTNIVSHSTVGFTGMDTKFCNFSPRSVNVASVQDKKVPHSVELSDRFARYAMLKCYTNNLLQKQAIKKEMEKPQRQEKRNIAPKRSISPGTGHYNPNPVSLSSNSYGENNYYNNQDNGGYSASYNSTYDNYNSPQPQMEIGSVNPMGPMYSHSQPETFSQSQSHFPNNGPMNQRFYDGARIIRNRPTMNDYTANMELAGQERYWRPEIKNSLRYKKLVQSSVHDIVPRKLSITAEMYQSINSEHLKSLFTMIDGYKTIGEIAEIFEINPMTITTMCRLLAERNLIALN